MEDLILMGAFRYPISHPVFEGFLSQKGILRAGDPSIPTNFKTGQVTDHILFHADKISDYDGESGVVLFEKNFFEGDSNEAARSFSEHRPLWITLNVPSQDKD